MSWVNQHECTGLIVPAGQPEPLRAAIERLMSDERFARGSDRADAIAWREFTMVKLRERLAALFKEMGC